MNLKLNEAFQEIQKAINIDQHELVNIVVDVIKTEIMILHPNDTISVLYLDGKVIITATDIHNESRDIDINKIPIYILNTIKSRYLTKIRNLKYSSKIIELKARENQLVTGKVVQVGHKFVVVSYLDTAFSISVKKFSVNDKILISSEFTFLLTSTIKKRGDQDTIRWDLDRNSNGFIHAVLNDNIPEIEDKLITVKGILRSAGIRTIIGITGCIKNTYFQCIGPKGERVKNISQTLGGERVLFIDLEENLNENIRLVFKIKYEPCFVIQRENNIIVFSTNQIIINKIQKYAQERQFIKVFYNSTISATTLAENPEDYRYFIINNFKITDEEKIASILHNFQNIDDIINTNPSLMVMNLLLTHDEVSGIIKETLSQLNIAFTIRSLEKIFSQDISINKYINHNYE